jgi:hypothetical protein
MSLIGEKSRIINKMDMEQLSLLMERYTLGNLCRVKDMVMEYKDGQMELYIKGNANKTKEKVTHISGGLKVMSIMDNTRMIRSTERV